MRTFEGLVNPGRLCGSPQVRPVARTVLRDKGKECLGHAGAQNMVWTVYCLERANHTRVFPGKNFSLQTTSVGRCEEEETTPLLRCRQAVLPADALSPGHQNLGHVSKHIWFTRRDPALADTGTAP